MQTYSASQLGELLRKYAGSDLPGALSQTPALLQTPPRRTEDSPESSDSNNHRPPLPGDAALLWKTARAFGGEGPSRLQPLRGRLCPALVFDCTHDNPTPFERMTPQAALALAAASAAGISPCGSTRGTDELVPFPLSVVTERRPYRRFTKTDFADEQDEAQGEASAEEARVEWPANSGCAKVEVFGGWNSWKEGKALLKTRDEWVGSVPYDCPFKFVVDGTWICSDVYPKQTDQGGNANNIITRTSRHRRHGEGGKLRVLTSQKASPSAKRSKPPFLCLVLGLPTAQESCERGLH